MSIFNFSQNDLFDDADKPSLGEMMLVNELAQLPSEELKKFCESEEAQALVEAGKLGKKTIVRLSKKDDEQRRYKLCLLNAIEENDPTLWQKIVDSRIKTKKLISQGEIKYGHLARRNAVLGQKEYLKNASKIHSVHLPNVLKKFGSNQ